MDGAPSCDRLCRRLHVAHGSSHGRFACSATGELRLVAGPALPRGSLRAMRRGRLRRTGQLHPGAREREPGPFRHLHRNGRRVHLRGRRHPPAVHDPVDVEAVHLRDCARGPGSAAGDREGRSRAIGRGVQLDQPRGRHRPATQSDDQRRRDHGGFADRRRLAGPAAQAGARLSTVVAPAGRCRGRYRSVTSPRC